MDTQDIVENFRQEAVREGFDKGAREARKGAREG